MIISQDEHKEESFLKEINKVPASHNLTFNLKTRRFKLKKYYTIKKDNSIKKLSLNQSVKKFYKLFNDSIKIRLRSDIEVGSCLSGGLDSSSIVSIASTKSHKNSKNKFQTFHAKYLNNPSSDESKYVEIVNKNFPTNSNIIEIDDELLLKYIDKSILIQEEPFLSPSVILQLIIMQKAQEKGCKVLLDGQGGDETLLGYERYYSKIIFNQKWNKKLNSFKMISNKSKLNLKTLIKYYLYFSFGYIRKRFLYKKTSFLTNTEELRNWKLNASKFFISSKTIFDLQKSEITDYQLPHLLRYEDKNSMHHSIETRLPFLDYKLLEFNLSVNDSYKIFDGWSKYILRKSLDNKLSDKIIWRKGKIGFELNEEKLINKIENQIFDLLDKSELSKKIFDVSKLKLNYSKYSPRMKWKLFNLLKWENSLKLRI